MRCKFLELNEMTPLSVISIIKNNSEMAMAPFSTTSDGKEVLRGN